MPLHDHNTDDNGRVARPLPDKSLSWMKAPRTEALTDTHAKSSPSKKSEQRGRVSMMRLGPTPRLALRRPGPRRSHVAAAAPRGLKCVVCTEAAHVAAALACETDGAASHRLVSNYSIQTAEG